jgi:flavin-dependent thymidylate synthase
MMRIVEPSFEILQMPDGEAALALLERVGRVAYKSEDKIDDGRRICDECCGDGSLEVVECGTEDLVRCEDCKGKGWIQEEPSSHKFIKMILKAERKAKLIKLAKEILETESETYLVPREGDTVADLPEEAWQVLVDHILDYMEQNPAHESVIEHCSATVLFTTNRGVTHELVRHRLCAFTQESTRYCNYNKGKFGNSITVTERPELEGDNYDIWSDGICRVENRYMELVKNGVQPQIARDLLPQALKADIVCTANFREWLHVFRMRCSPAAHPDMRRLMIPLREEFRRRIPIIFDAR